MTAWKQPVEQTVSAVWSDWMEEQDHHKDYAAKTTFRFSDAMACSRQLSYTAAGVSETDPMDGPSLAIAGMGTLLHERIQKAVADRWLSAEFETTAQIEDLTSGHVDIDNPEEDEIVEIKTVGAFKFDQSIGLVRSPGRGKPAYIKEAGGKGPSLSHVCQGGFNAKARGRSNVIIVYVSREAVSIQKAKELKFSSLDRFTAEWLIPQTVWWPIVEKEMQRLGVIRAQVAYGVISDRVWPNDDGSDELVTPGKTQFPCGYCRFESRCKADGPGIVSIPTEQEAS